MNVLRANGNGRDNPTSTNADDNENPRRLAFLTVPNAKDSQNPRGGIVPDTASSKQGMLVDPWGNPYIIRMDGNYDHVLNNPYGSNAGPLILNDDVIAWSIGKDGASGSVTTHMDAGAGGADKKVSPNDDDIISW